jgi:hypothetical protein
VPIIHYITAQTTLHYTTSQHSTAGAKQIDRQTVSQTVRHAEPQQAGQEQGQHEQHNTTHTVTHITYMRALLCPPYIIRRQHIYLFSMTHNKHIYDTSTSYTRSNNYEEEHLFIKGITFQRRVDCKFSPLRGPLSFHLFPGPRAKARTHRP